MIQTPYITKNKLKKDYYYSQDQKEDPGAKYYYRQKSTAPGIRAWSPTALLTGPLRA